MDKISRRDKIVDKFNHYFNSSPQYWTYAPGRVELLGSHTDYNLGFVMTMAIDRDIWIAAKPRKDNLVNCISLNLQSKGQFNLKNIVPSLSTPWINYIQGVALYLIKDGYELNGFDAIIDSTIPLDAGLSSSAALEIAVLELLQVLGGFKLSKLNRARIGQKAENNFVGVNTGILDQYSSVFGKKDKAMLLDTKELKSTPIDIPKDIQVVVCDTSTKRNLVGSEYDIRRKQCESGVTKMKKMGGKLDSLRDINLELFKKFKPELPVIVAKRCQFIIEENERVLDMATALPAEDKEKLGELYSQSFIGARDLYEIITEPMQAMFEVMNNAPGSLAARQSGAGFGGSMIALVEKDLVDQFCEYVCQHYLRRTGLKPNVYPVNASDGAGVLFF